MSTVVDELIISLGLDPTKFDQGQRKALGSLRDFQQKAEKTTSDISDRTGAKMALFFRALNNPLQAVHEHLFKLATTSERTAQSVSGVTSVATTGMRGLAAAALLAFGAFKGIQAVMRGMDRSMQWAQGVGWAQSWFGVPEKLSSTLATAAFEQTGAPREQTVNWLSGMAATLGAWKAYGRPLPESYLEAFTRLSPFGLNLSDSLPKIIAELPGALAAYKAHYGAAAATGIAQQLGMSPNLAGFFEKGPAAYQRAMQRAAPDVVTKNEADALTKLGKAEREVTVNAEKLTRALAVNFGPTLIQVLTSLSDWIKYVIKVVKGFTTNPNEGVSGTAKFLEGKLPIKGLPGLAPSTPKAVPQSYLKPATPAENAMLAAIAQKESGDQNVWNYKHSSNPDYFTAGGYWQTIDTNWKAYAPLFGIDTTKYPHAIDAPKADQKKVALYLLRRYGITPWDTSHGGSIPVGTVPSSLAALGRPNPQKAALQHLAARVAHQVASVHAGSKSTTTNTSTVTHAGPVTVHVHGSGNPHQAASAVVRAINNAHLAQGFNTLIE